MLTWWVSLSRRAPVRRPVPKVSVGGARSIWLRHDLETMKKRLKALKACYAQDDNCWRTPKSRLRKKPNLRKKRMRRSKPIIGVVWARRIALSWVWWRVRIFIYIYSRVAQAKFYIKKTAVIAANMLNDKVTPFFDEQSTDRLHILIHRGMKILREDRKSHLSAL